MRTNPDHARELRAAYEEWADNQAGLRPEPAIHTAWIRYVLQTTLEFPDEVLAEGQAIPQGLRFTISESARREVLGRLLALNHQRYEEEVLAGLTRRSRRGKRRSKGAEEQKCRGDYFDLRLAGVQWRGRKTDPKDSLWPNKW